MHRRLAIRADSTSQVKRLFTLTIVLLGFAVFFWGLHDKLSLYAPPNMPPPMARAKLLSQAEQPSTKAETAMPQPPETMAPLLSGFFAAFLATLFVASLEPVDATQLRSIPRSPPLLPAMRRRPPPCRATLAVGADAAFLPQIA